MVRLSVIIVNYNVKYFLEQALVSSLKAAERVSTEIIVVDNKSVDGSVEMVEKRFPEVTMIRNLENTGFSVANNQGMEIAKGDYFLLLNPDTVVEEDTFEKIVRFMDEHPDAGGLGVKMLDGRGKFLPESKRGFPTPAVAFYKAFGLSSIFPKSKTFGRYHLGFLGEDETSEVDVLAGAFMMLRKKVIDEIGGLDETFFMYGEDIDLSYRIVKAGYKNYYFPGTRIIHYKGESTKKGSLNYVRMFYAAMKIFAEKHFSGSSAWLLILLINIAIYMRATMALTRRFINQFAWPIIDTGLIFGGMYILKNFWESNIKSMDAVTYPPEYLFINVPLYIATWLFAVYLSGGYDRDTKPARIVRGLLLGTLLIAAIYGFLEEGLRFSRGMILSGAVWASVAMLGVRFAWNLVNEGNLRFGEPEQQQIVIIGGEKEALRVKGLLERYEVDSDFIGFVKASSSQSFSDERVLGSLEELPEITTVFNIDELIFCGADVPSAEIISWMTKLGAGKNYKIVPREALSIIGSNSKNTAGDLYSIDVHLNIDEPRNRRSKRIFDLLFALFLFVSFPVHLFIVRRPAGLLRNILSAIIGQKSWVGYYPPATEKNQPSKALPILKSGILSPLDALRKKEGKVLGEHTLDRLNLMYARDYEVEKDWSICWKGWRELGR